MVGLAKLIAVHRIVEEVCEVREQVQVVPDSVAHNLEGGITVRSLPLDGAAVAVCVAAVCRIQGAEAGDDPFVDRTLRDLVR